MTDNLSKRIRRALDDIQKIRTLFKWKYGEECPADKEIEEVLKIAKTEHEEIQRYRAIGTVEECREGRERLRAKKPVEDEYKHDCCPNCGWIVYQDEWGGRYLTHCENCGQAIDWGKRFY